ncbi:hypothetical protein V8E55_011908 [Tylopilus felleus]
MRSKHAPPLATILYAICFLQNCCPFDLNHGIGYTAPHNLSTLGAYLERPESGTVYAIGDSTPARYPPLSDFVLVPVNLLACTLIQTPLIRPTPSGRPESQRCPSRFDPCRLALQLCYCGSPPSST